MIDETDVLFVRHGAGFSHVLFLPPHAAMIELVPVYDGVNNHHFADMAAWRKLVYWRWRSTDRNSEMYNFETSVLVNVVGRCLKKVVGKMCEPGRTLPIRT